MARCRGHNLIVVGDLTFCSDFDNGNLKAVEESGRSGYDFQLWTASDNCGTQHESNHSSWFHFSVTGLPKNATIKFRMMNTKKHGGLYRSDMRPVFRCNATQNKWMRIKKSVRTDEDGRQAFEHTADLEGDVVYFSFTYPYSYATLQSELASIEAAHTNTLDAPGSIYFNRELIACSIEQRRIDLLTITAAGGHSEQQEEVMPGLFPAHGIGDAACPGQALGAAGRPLTFPGREVIIVSARVHPGEVPAQHTMRGILDLLLDPHDPRSRALRERFVFKIVPMLNPDGVFRGHFRMDQLGQNLNRYYTNPDKLKQPSIFALRRLIDLYAGDASLAMYLDLHAHASKKGCFIYGNVVDTLEDQVQNQLYCRLIALNTPHFDYEGCLFSRDHMARTDPGDGMTAEGSSRVCTYLTHRLVHSYTLECNYNTGRIGNEVVPPEGELGASSLNPAHRSCEFTTSPEKYTPMSWQNVGQACLIAMLDIRGQNPCSRIPKTKFRTLDRIRMLAVTDVRQLSEFRGCPVPDALRRDNLAANMSRLPADKNKNKTKPGRGSAKINSGSDNNPTAAARARAAELMWRRFCPQPSAEGTTPTTTTTTVSRRRSSASGPSDTASAPPLERHKPRPPRQPVMPQNTSAKSSGKVTPRSAKVGDGKSQPNINNKELSRSGPVNATPEKDPRGPRPTHRGVNAPITVTELKKQLHHKLEVSASSRDSDASPPVNIDDEMTKMVSTAHRGDHSALTEAMSEGTMHPPPRPLTLLLKGKGGSGMSPPGQGCSQVPTTNLLRQRHSRQRLRSDSAGSNASNIDNSGVDQSGVYEENKTTSSLLTSDDLNNTPVHRVYPLRASHRGGADSAGDNTSVSSDICSTDAVDSIIVNKTGTYDDENNIARTVPILERASKVSASPSKTVVKVTAVDAYDVASERGKATQHIAKLMGRDITNNSPTPSV